MVTVNPVVGGWAGDIAPGWPADARRGSTGSPSTAVVVGEEPLEGDGTCPAGDAAGTEGVRRSAGERWRGGTSTIALVRREMRSMSVQRDVVAVGSAISGARADRRLARRANRWFKPNVDQRHGLIANLHVWVRRRRRFRSSSYP